MTAGNPPSPAQIARKALLSDISKAQELVASGDTSRDALLASLSIALRVINSTRKNVAWRIALRDRLKASSIKHRRTSPEILAVVKLLYPEHRSDDHFLYTGFLAYACFQGWVSGSILEKFLATNMTMTEAARAGRKQAIEHGWPTLEIWPRNKAPTLPPRKTRLAQTL